MLVKLAFFRETGTDDLPFFRWDEVDMLPVVATAAVHVAGHIGIVAAGFVQPEECTVSAVGAVCRGGA